MLYIRETIENWNYLSWVGSIELWFIGQGYENHLAKQESNILKVDCVPWRKINVQLCSVLWQFVDVKNLASS